MTCTINFRNYRYDSSNIYILASTQASTQPISCLQGAHFKFAYKNLPNGGKVVSNGLYLVCLLLPESAICAPKHTFLNCCQTTTIFLYNIIIEKCSNECDVVWL